MANTEKEDIVTVKVARRKSVEFNGELHLSGAMFDIGMTDAMDLHKKGFVVDPREDLDDDGGEAK